MSVFRYKAVGQTGDIVEGTLEAADRAGAVARLSDMGYVPISAEPESKGSLAALLSTDIMGGRSRRLSARDVMIATRELATLLEAGVELERALGILVELSARPSVSTLFAGVLDDVRGGSALSDALEKRAGQFPKSYISLVRAGEAGGALDIVFERLAAYLESAHAARENLRSALVYPTLLLVMAIIAVAVMVTVVLPQFEPLFASSGKKLPLLTRIVMGSSDAVEHYGWIAAVVALGGAAFFRQRLRDPVARIAWHARFLAVPLFGSLLLKSDVARLARTLATLLQNGVPTLSAIAIVRETVANAALAEGVGVAAERVQSGATMSDALSTVPRFPDLAAHLIRIGEETGKLESMLERTALIYEDETRRTVQRLLALLLPGLTALMGLFIATIIASIFLAIVSLNQLAF